MSRGGTPAGTIAELAERLNRQTDLSSFDLAVSSPATTLPLAVLFLGCAAPVGETPPLGLPAALELMDAAVRVHYYEPDGSLKDRLIAGDNWYARAMLSVSALRRPDLVSVLASATASVAEGHSLPDGDPDALRKRSALFPAAIELAILSAGVDECGPVREYAAELGRVREALLGGIRTDAGGLVELRQEIDRQGLLGDYAVLLHPLVDRLAGQAS
ncbi:MAG: hypothetical protein C4521_10760 [Actinobacteria bacterium]|nr:MAG: hypothetical protein C4521_10760 [Actinomycetota bacterium]